MDDPTQESLEQPKAKDSENRYEIAHDGYLTHLLDLNYDTHKLINSVLDEAFNFDLEFNNFSWSKLDLKKFSSITNIFQCDSELQIEVIYACLNRIKSIERISRYEIISSGGIGQFSVRQAPISKEAQKHISRVYILPLLLKILFSRKLPFTELDFHNLIQLIISMHCFNHDVPSPIGSLLSNIERYISTNGISQNLRADLEQLWLSRKRSMFKKAEAYRLDVLLGKRGVELGDAWSETTLLDLAGMNRSAHQAWDSLIRHALSADASEPPTRWLKQAQELLNALEEGDFKHYLLKWLPLFKDPGKHAKLTLIELYGNFPPPSSDRNSTILKGLVWCCSLFEDEEIIQAIATLADDSFKKIPNFGPRSLKVGNACLYTLSVMPGKLAIAHLERLRQKCKNGTIKKQIEKAFDRAAQRAELSREDLAEVMLPTYDLNDQGIATQLLGDFTAEIRILNTHTVTLNWFKPDGKPQKSVPAAVKKEHAAALKTLKRTVDDIQKLLIAQRDRIESLYLNPRTWNYTTWQERYLQHPLLSQLAKRLIWQFEHNGTVALGIWHDGKLVDEGDRPLTTPPDTAQVTLWHPIASDPTTVLAWRTWLETFQIAQPFKQAHREVYLLTDAERQTDTYSNRFAAHILRQHQFAALAHQTGWRYSLQGHHFDGHNVPTRDLPHWNLRIEYWVDIAGEQLSSAGISLHLVTDQVRFCNPLGVPQSVETISAIIFSEVMRNIDFFVGVGSIGNDPNWQDQGTQALPYNDYWQTYALGDLSTTAQIRREVLSRLLPKLKIRDHCSLSDKFLIVQGTIRTYKIHLGSGTILMEPNSQYLCIVPSYDKKASADSVFLPFEGDNTLSVILSKAFLLANDAQIQDPTILSQIQRKNILANRHE
jgi:Domain of unknown function (DUF4132)